MEMPDTLRWHDGVLILLDQTRLPLNESYIHCRDYRRVAEAIKRLEVRGAPAIGAAAAFEDEDYFRATCQQVIDSREAVVAGLQAHGFEVLPSAANFVFARHPQRDAATLAAGLREQGVIVRHFKQARIAQLKQCTYRHSRPDFQSGYGRGASSHPGHPGSLRS